jgi:hypothetical protein
MTEQQTHTLLQYAEMLAVVRLGPGTEIPAWASAGSIFSVTATATETSIVCGRRGVPKKAPQQGPFVAFCVEGQLDFALTGVLSGLLAPLAEAGVPVFTISTYDTDWILVPANDAEKTAAAWRGAGHTVRSAHEAPEESGTAGSGTDQPGEES